MPTLAIREWRNRAGLTLEDVAADIEMSPGNLSLLERGKQGFSETILLKLARFYGTVPAGLFYPPPDNDDAHNAAALGERIAAYEAPAKSEVAFFDWQIAAGDGAYVDDPHQTGTISFERPWLKELTNSPPHRLIIIQLKGDSMEPTLPDGSWVMIDLNDTRPVTNKIFAFREDDEARIKRLSVHPGTKRLSLISDNPRWPDVNDIEPDRLEIYGRAIWFSKKL